MARDFAAVLGKDIKNQEYLSNCWFYGFIGRWPEMKVVKPQKLTTSKQKRHPVKYWESITRN